MKNLFKILVLGLVMLPSVIITKAAPEKEKPTVVLMEVNKSGGGYGAPLNLYANINYSVQSYDANTNTVYAKLECDGNGLSACRAPRQAVYGPSSVATHNGSYSESITQNINSLIDAAEKSINTGNQKGGKTQKSVIFVAGKSKLYFYNATWNLDKYGNGKITIRVTEDPTGIASRL